MCINHVNFEHVWAEHSPVALSVKLNSDVPCSPE